MKNKRMMKSEMRSKNSDEWDSKEGHRKKTKHRERNGAQVAKMFLKIRGGEAKNILKGWISVQSTARVEFKCGA